MHLNRNRDPWIAVGFSSLAVVSICLGDLYGRNQDLREEVEHIRASYVGRCDLEAGLEEVATRLEVLELARPQAKIGAGGARYGGG